MTFTTAQAAIEDARYWIKIEELPISTRARYALTQHPYERAYVFDLARATATRGLGTPNFGSRAMSELKNALALLGIGIGSIHPDTVIDDQARSSARQRHIDSGAIPRLIDERLSAPAPRIDALQLTVAPTHGGNLTITVDTNPRDDLLRGLLAAWAASSHALSTELVRRETRKSLHQSHALRLTASLSVPRGTTPSLQPVDPAPVSLSEEAGPHTEVQPPPHDHAAHLARLAAILQSFPNATAADKPRDVIDHRRRVLIEATHAYFEHAVDDDANALAATTDITAHIIRLLVATAPATQPLDPAAFFRAGDTSLLESDTPGHARFLTSAFRALADVANTRSFDQDRFALALRIADGLVTSPAYAHPPSRSVADFLVQRLWDHCATEELVNGGDQMVRNPEPLAAMDLLAFATRAGVPISSYGLQRICDMKEVFFLSRGIYCRQLEDFIRALDDHIAAFDSLRNDAALRNGVEQIRQLLSDHFPQHRAPDRTRFDAIERLATTLRSQGFDTNP